MGKNGLGSLLGAALFAGAAYGAYKYLKEYTNFKKESEEDFRDLEENADGIRTAAKRTYVAIKERSSGEEIKAAAGDLLQKTGDAARNVGNIAAAAGKTTADAVRDMTSRYQEDPDGVKEELQEKWEGLKADAKEQYEDLKAEAKETFEEMKDLAKDAALGFQNENADPYEEEAKAPFSSQEEEPAADAAPEEPAEAAAEAEPEAAVAGSAPEEAPAPEAEIKDDVI